MKPGFVQRRASGYWRAAPCARIGDGSGESGVPHRLQDSFYRALFESPVAGIAVADISSLTVTATNQRMLDILGRTRDEVVGIPEVWREITPAEYYEREAEALAQLLERGVSEPFDKEYLRPDGSRIPVRISVTTVEGEPDKAVAFVQDLTADRAARAREQDIQKRLEIALSAAKQGVWDYNLVTGEMVYDDRAKQIYGLPLDQTVTFEIIRDATHPEDLPYTHGQLLRAIDPKIRDRNSYEYRIVRPDGSICWALAHGEAVFEGEGEEERAVRYAGTIQDITDRKAAERHQQILIAELNHRVKNMLAIVQAIAHQTFRGVDCGDAGETFAGRLSALAAAHTILTRRSWEDAELGEIASAVLEPHRNRDNAQIRLSGARDVKVPPQTALNLAMALHELATNAAKYGALSTRGGHVDLSWRLTHSEPVLHLDWRESGGPPVTSPEREGFGTRMIRRVLASELGGKVRLAFNSDGLECSIEAPLNTGTED
jgi:PAS domain S-box-containing protein